MAGKKRRHTETENDTGSSPSQVHSDQLSQVNQGDNAGQEIPSTTSSAQTTTTNIASLTTPVQNLAAPSTVPVSASSSAVTEEPIAEPTRKKQKKPRRPKDAPSPDWSARVRGRLTEAERCPQACDRCTEKKMRCDDEPGDCKNCQGRGVPCWLTDKNSKRTYRRGITPLLVEENNRLWRMVSAMDAELNQLRSMANAQRHEYPVLESLQNPHHGQQQYGGYGNTYAHPRTPMPPEQYQRMYSRVPFPATLDDLMPPPLPPAQTTSFQQQSIYATDTSVDNTSRLHPPVPSMTSSQMPSLYSIDPSITGERRGQSHIYQYNPDPQSLQAYNTIPDPMSSYRELPLPHPPVPSASGDIATPTQSQTRNPFPTYLPHLNYPSRARQTTPRAGTSNLPPPPGIWQPEDPPDAIFNPQRVNAMDPSPFAQQGSTPTGPPSRMMNPAQVQQGSSWQVGNPTDTPFNPQRTSAIEQLGFMHQRRTSTHAQSRGVNLNLQQRQQTPQPRTPPTESEEQRGYVPDPASGGSYGQQKQQPPPQ